MWSEGHPLARSHPAVRADRNSRDCRRQGDTCRNRVRTSRLHADCTEAVSQRTPDSGLHPLARSAQRRFADRENGAIGLEQSLPITNVARSKPQESIILASGSWAVIGSGFGHTVPERRIFRVAPAQEAEFARVSEGIRAQRANRARGRRRPAGAAHLQNRFARFAPHSDLACRPRLKRACVSSAARATERFAARILPVDSRSVRA